MHLIASKRREPSFPFVTPCIASVFLSGILFSVKFQSPSNVDGSLQRSILFSTIRFWARFNQFVNISVQSLLTEKKRYILKMVYFSASIQRMPYQRHFVIVQNHVMQFFLSTHCLLVMSWQWKKKILKLAERTELPSKPLILDLMETLDLFFRRACCALRVLQKNQWNKNCRQTYNLGSRFCSFSAWN